MLAIKLINIKEMANYHVSKKNNIGKWGVKKEGAEKYIRKEKLIESLAQLVYEVKSKHEALKERLTHEVEKFNQLQKLVAGAGEHKQINVMRRILLNNLL